MTPDSDSRHETPAWVVLLMALSLVTGLAFLLHIGGVALVGGGSQKAADAPEPIRIAAETFDTATFNTARGPLIVRRITPGGTEVRDKRQIVIHFSRPVVALGQMDRTAVELGVTVAPEPGCEWRWLNTSDLACQLTDADALQPATEYTVTVEPGLTAEDGAQLEEKKVHTFATERPKAVGSYLVGWKSPEEPHFLVIFNQPVDKKSVREHVYFLVGDDAPERVLAHLEPLPEEIARRYRWRFGANVRENPNEAGWLLVPPQPFPPDTHVVVRDEPGVKSLRGPLPSDQERDLASTDTFPAFRFLGVTCRIDAVKNPDKRVIATLKLGDADLDSKRCYPEARHNGRVTVVFTAPLKKDSLPDKVTLSRQLQDGKKLAELWDSIYIRDSHTGTHTRGDNYGFGIPGDLYPFTDYTVTTKDGITDLFGRSLDNPDELQFYTDHLIPELFWLNDRAVLEKKEKTEFPFTVVNTPKFTLLYETLTAGGRKRPTEKEYTLDLTEDAWRRMALGLRGLLKSESGAVLGKRIGEKPPYTFFGQVTPYHVHVKYGHYNTLVWVTDLQSGKPVRGAEVEMYLGNYHELPASPSVKSDGVTDANGLAELAGSETLDPKLSARGYHRSFSSNNRFFFVRVTKGDDMALVPLEGYFGVSPWTTDWYIPQTRARRYGHLKIWGTTAQGVYKAGDTIQYKIFVRDQNNTNFTLPPKDATYSLWIYDAQGNELEKKEGLTLTKFGTLAGEVTVPHTAPVGWYRFVLGSSVHTKKHEAMRVLVSDFTPAPFRVTTELEEEIYRPGHTYPVHTVAALHGGGPYVDAKNRVTLYVISRWLKAKSPEYSRFYFNSGGGRETLFQETAALDKKGERTTRVHVPVAKNISYGTLRAESAVSDDRGKHVAHEAGAIYAGRTRYVGMHTTSWLWTEDEPNTLDLLVINDAREPVAGARIDVVVEREERKVAQVKSAGAAYVPQYTTEWVKAGTCTITSEPGPASCVFTPGKPGSHRIRATIKDTKGRKHATQRYQYVRGSDYVMWDDEEGLTIIPDKDEYAVGDTARFLIKNPYPGARALVTVERFGVIDSRVETFADSMPVVSIPVTADSVPGFYLSVVVMSPRVDKPPDDDGVDLGKPAFRMGYLKVPINDPAKRIEAAVTTDKDTYKPREMVTVDIHATAPDGSTPPMELAVAVIDESVFDLIQGGATYYDPYKGFYALDALDLSNFNLLQQIVGRMVLADEAAALKAGTQGGGGGPDVALRSLFKFISYWNPSVFTNAAGTAQVQFPVPDNLTGWRVLALAVDANDLMGLGEGTFVVNKPTEIRPALPNQVLEGDAFDAVFTVMNRTDAPRTLNVTITAAGPTASDDSVTTTLTAEPWVRYRVRRPTTATRDGVIEYTVTASDGTDGDKVLAPLPVNKQKALETSATYGTTTRDTVSEKVKFPQDMRGDVGAVSLVAAPSVISDVDGAFAYMRDYPYVCWEQRLSKGVMAAHYVDLKQYLSEEITWDNPGDVATQMLADAANFQAPNGGMVYWIPQNRYVSPYLSAYTALAFNWLRDKGYAIPATVEDKLHGYLKTLFRQSTGPDFYSRRHWATVRAVALAALTRHGAIHSDDVLRFERHVPDMSLFGRSMYADALHYVDGSGEVRTRVYDNILAHANVSGGKYRFTEEHFLGMQRILDTPLKANCTILSSLLTYQGATDAPDDVPFKLVRFISQTRKAKGHWESTHENVFCMNALVEFARAYEEDAPAFEVIADLDGEAMGVARFDDVRTPPRILERPVAPNDPGRTATLNIQRKGVGRLYYAARLLWSPKKLKTEPVNSGIEVRREYSIKTDAGWKLAPQTMTLTQGDLVRVDLFVSVPSARNFVVVDDPVPGGLEPVNRDLATTSTLDDASTDMYPRGSWWYTYDDWYRFAYGRWAFYHKELRHHAARFYSEYLDAGNYHLQYSAQAIAPGTFTVPPTHSEEMYDPDVYGQGAPAQLIVNANQ